MMKAQARKKPVGESVYQIKVLLMGSDPPIWRKIQVKSDATLSDLHRILQLVMGWEDEHLHEFEIGDVSFGPHFPDGPSDTKNEAKAKLNKLVKKEGFRFRYIYDFGDDWEHELIVEKVLSADSKTRYPACVGGERACPPEDCGGIWGYYDMLETIQDPEAPEREELLEWIGDDFDPDAFSVDGVNRLLQRLK